jgi:hypothetical protein
MKDEHKDAIEVSVIFHEGQRMMAVPKHPAPVQPADGTQVSKVWWDGEKLMAKPIPLEDFYLPAPVQEPVAHCEAGPGHCQQCYLEDRSLALAAAVRYVQNNTPKLVSDEICMALTTPPAAQQEFVGLTDEDKLHIEMMGGKSDVMLAEMVEAKLKERNVWKI